MDQTFQHFNTKYIFHIGFYWVVISSEKTLERHLVKMTSRSPLLSLWPCGSTGRATHGVITFVTCAKVPLRLINRTGVQLGLLALCSGPGVAFSSCQCQVTLRCSRDIFIWRCCGGGSALPQPNQPFGEPEGILQTVLGYSGAMTGVGLAHALIYSFPWAGWCW